MKPIHTRNFGADRNDHLNNAAKSIGRSPQRLEVFLAICKTKKKEKSVSWIKDHTNLQNNKRVTEEAKKLVNDEIIMQLDHKINGETGYAKIDFFCKHKNEILRLIKNKKFRDTFPTKINPRTKIPSVINVNLHAINKTAKPKITSIQDIEEFSKIKGMKSLEYDLEKNEDDIKKLFKKIAGETGKFSDSSVEKNDLLMYLTFNGKKTLAAFALKGKSQRKIKKLRPMDMGKNGDQIERLFSSPAEIFFVQFVGQFHDLMFSKMEEQALLKSHYTGKTIYYGLIDGNDTSKIFAKYG